MIAVLVITDNPIITIITVIITIIIICLVIRGDDRRPGDHRQPHLITALWGANQIRGCQRENAFQFGQMAWLGFGWRGEGSANSKLDTPLLLPIHH